MATKPKLEGKEWSRMVGKTTLIRVDWKSFDDEFPKHGEDIVVILKCKDGYGPFHAEYLQSGENWKEVRFREPMFPTIYMGSKEWKRLVAWGRFKVVKQITEECPMCKQLICQC